MIGEEEEEQENKIVKCYFIVFRNIITKYNNEESVYDKNMTCKKMKLFLISILN